MVRRAPCEAELAEVFFSVPCPSQIHGVALFRCSCDNFGSRLCGDKQVKTISPGKMGFASDHQVLFVLCRHLNRS